MSTTNVEYDGENNLESFLRDYFNPKNESYQYLIIKKNINENTGLIINDTHNRVFRKIQTNIITGETPQCPTGQEWSTQYNKCIPICKVGEHYDPASDKCVPDQVGTEILVNQYVTNITASKDDGNVVNNVLDNDINTRWSAEGTNDFIDIEFSKLIEFKKVEIAFYKGNARQNDFVINSQNFRSSGKTLELEPFVLSSTLIGTKLHIDFKGNTQNQWNSITELKVYGIVKDGEPQQKELTAKLVTKEVKAGELATVDGSQSIIKNIPIEQVQIEFTQPPNQIVPLANTQNPLIKSFPTNPNLIGNTYNFGLNLKHEALSSTTNGQIKVVQDVIHTCPIGEHWDEQQQKCVPDVVTGDIDSYGIQWLVAKGQQSLIQMSRDEATDDRWSGNISGLALGFEATFIGKSIGTNSSSHFAMKMFGGNHSKGDWQKQRWYDLGVRYDGTIQTQVELLHPNNKDFTLPDRCQPIKKLSKPLENNWIGLKWSALKVNGKPDGSPANGGVRVRMWVNEDPIDTNGKVNNAGWKLALDFIDGIDITVFDTPEFSAPDTQDCEVRRSDTKQHDVFGDGKIYTNAQDGTPALHVRALYQAATFTPTIQKVALSEGHIIQKKYRKHSV